MALIKVTTIITVNIDCSASRSMFVCLLSLAYIYQSQDEIASSGMLLNPKVLIFMD